MLARAAVVLVIAATFAAVAAASWSAVAARVRASGLTPRDRILRPDAGEPAPEPPAFEWAPAPEAPPMPPAVAPASWAPMDWPMDPPVKHAGLSYPTIQAAVAAAEDGGTILLPRGVYSRPVAIRDRHDLTLQGEGGPAFILVPSNRGAAVSIDGSRRIALRDVMIRQDAPPGSCPSAVALRVARSADVYLSRVYLGGCARASLSADQVSGLTVSDSILEDAAEVALRGEQMEGDLVVARSDLSSRGIAARLSGEARLLLSAARLAPAPGRAALELSGRFEGAIQGNVLLGPVRIPGPALPSIEGKNRFVQAEPGRPSLVPGPPGADLGWRPPVDFASSGLDAFSPEAQRLPPGQDASLVGRSLLLCGRGGPRAFHAVPGGMPLDLLLPACEAIAPTSRDDGVLLHQVVEQREGWIKVRYDVRGEGRRGTAWLETADLATACTVEVGDQHLLTGLFHPAVKGARDGKLLLEGGRSACASAPDVEEVPLPAPAAAARGQAPRVRCAHRPPACGG